MNHAWLKFLLLLKYWPYILVYANINKQTDLTDEWMRYAERWISPYSGMFAFLWVVKMFPEYRSVLYFRIKNAYVNFLCRFYPPQTTLYIQVKSHIGKNFFIWHGFSTIINAETIGDNCEIWQQVTIGNKFNEDGEKPRLGNNVKVCAGAIIIGDIHIGDNAIIGAGAVVTKDVPANVIVAGVPARIIKILENA